MDSIKNKTVTSEPGDAMMGYLLSRVLCVDLG